MSRLTVATYNLYLGADIEPLFRAGSVEELAGTAEQVRRQLAATDFPDRAEALARVLARERPDVVGVQELTRWTTAAPGPDGTLADPEVVVDFLPVLLTALADVGCPYDVHAHDRNFSGGLPVAAGWMGIEGANALLVRRGGALTVTSEHTASYAATLEVATGIDGVSFPIVRGCGGVEATVSGRPVLVVNTHLEAYDPDIRGAQRDELLAAVGGPGRPVVLLGDLNAEPADVGIGPPYEDAWLVAGGDPGAGPTCGQAATLDNRESRLGVRIDYVFVRDAEVLECRVVGDQEADRTRRARLWPSDHAGVLARLEF